MSSDDDDDESKAPEPARGVSLSSRLSFLSVWLFQVRMFESAGFDLAVRRGVIATRQVRRPDTEADKVLLRGI